MTRHNSYHRSRRSLSPRSPRRGRSPVVSFRPSGSQSRRFDTQSVRQVYEGSEKRHPYYKHFLDCNTMTSIPQEGPGYYVEAKPVDKTLTKETIKQWFKNILKSHFYVHHVSVALHVLMMRSLTDSRLPIDPQRWTTRLLSVWNPKQICNSA